MPGFQLTPECWYAWQMFPGYFGSRCVPYSSPIYMQFVKPLKSGMGNLNIKFVNAMYAEGVQGFDVDLRILGRYENYLVGEIDSCGASNTGRVAIISHIEFDWVRQCCPEIWWARPPASYNATIQGSISLYLDEVFKISNQQSDGNSVL